MKQSKVFIERIDEITGDPIYFGTFNVLEMKWNTEGEVTLLGIQLDTPLNLFYMINGEDGKFFNKQDPNFVGTLITE